MINNFFSIDECEQEPECNCSRKFRNDDHHQYTLSNSHRLTSKQRLDLIALMRNDIYDRQSSLSISPILDETIRKSTSNSSILGDDPRRKSSNMDENDSRTQLSQTIDGFRRKKSASLNSTVNSGKSRHFIKIFCFLFPMIYIFIIEHRPTVEELERREYPWCWKSYSVRFFVCSSIKYL